MMRGDDIDHDVVLARVRALLDDDVAHIDENARQRLGHARRAAVASARVAPRWHGFAWPALALAAALVVWLGTNTSTTPLPAPAPSADVADYAQGLVVATEEDAAALDEDLEFYAWLDAQSQGG